MTHAALRWTWGTVRFLLLFLAGTVLVGVEITVLLMLLGGIWRRQQARPRPAAPERRIPFIDTDGGVLLNWTVKAAICAAGYYLLYYHGGIFLPAPH